MVRGLPARQVLGFGIVGSIGFLVEASVLQVLYVLGVPPFWGRFVSFPVAVVITWQLNRNFTFKARPPGQAGAAWYVAGQLLGALINLGVFVGAMKIWPALQDWPVVPLALGSGVAMVFNFCWSRAVVFRAPQPSG